MTTNGLGVRKTISVIFLSLSFKWQGYCKIPQFHTSDIEHAQRQSSVLRQGQYFTLLGIWKWKVFIPETAFCPCTYIYIQLFDRYFHPMQAKTSKQVTWGEIFFVSFSFILIIDSVDVICGERHTKWARFNPVIANCLMKFWMLDSSGHMKSVI